MFTDTRLTLQAVAPDWAPAGVPDRGAVRADLLGRPVPHPLPPWAGDHRGGQRLAQVSHCTITFNSRFYFVSVKKAFRTQKA